ncbi:hypothetical protein ACIQ9P_10195 [Kitasatospora sp. NPDC094019]|uniref:hypothetical protein n=1 Tax=Kitasatospora sp. NPDC094019 TaxID=3364091 RepID=UPI0038033471
MRTSRLAATATLFVLTGGALVGGTTGAAADSGPSPSASATAEPTASATVATPSATAGELTPTTSTTVTPSATGTPPATATASSPGTAPATPSATSTPTAGCESEHRVTMPTHAVPSAATLVRSGQPQDLAFSFYNDSDTVLTDFRVTYRIEGPRGGAPFKPLVRIQGGPFTPVEPNDGTGTTAVGSFQVPAHEMVTAELRFTDEPGTLSGDYAVTVAGTSEPLPYGDAKYQCDRLLGSLTSRLTLADPAPVTTVPGTDTGTDTAATPAPASTESASPTVPTPPAPTAGTGPTGDNRTGTRLAGTGTGSGDLPLAITGGMAIALGLGAVIVARRRNRAAPTTTTRD